MVIDIEWKCPVCGGKVVTKVHHADVRLPHTKKTNRDALRLMDNDALAEWLLGLPDMDGNVCPPPFKGEECPTSPCNNCWIGWLSEEVKDG